MQYQYHMPQQPQPTGTWLTSKRVQFCIMLVFGFGVVACVAILIGAMVAVAMLLNLAMQTLCELAANVHQLYAGSDNITRLLILGIVTYIVLRLGQRAYHSFFPKNTGGGAA